LPTLCIEHSTLRDATTPYTDRWQTLIKLITLKYKLLLIAILLFSIKAFSQCPEAEKYVQKVKEAESWTPTERAKSGNKIQGWTQFGAWHAYKCECDAGNLSTQDAERLKDHLNTIRGTIQSLYSKYGSVPPVVTKCNSSEGKAGQTQSLENDKFSFYNDPLINRQVEGFIHELAANSNNPDLKKMSTELAGLHKAQADVNQYRDFFNITPTQQDLEFDRTMQNIGQIISVGKFLVNSLKEKEVQLSPSQQQAKESMRKLLINIKQLQIEQNKIPYLKDKREDPLEILNEYEKSLYIYDLATAKQRLFLIKYYWSSHYLDLNELETLNRQIYSLSNLEAIKQIEQLQSSTNFKNAFYLQNKDQSFKVTNYIIQLHKIKLLKEQGKTKEAETIENSLNFDITLGEAITIMKEAFYNGDYETTAQLYPLAKQYFESNPIANSVDKSAFFIYVGEGKKDLVLSTDFVLMLLSSGIYSTIIENNYGSAEQDLALLNTLKLNNNTRGEGVIEGINTLILVQNKKNEEALVEINKGIDLLTETTGVYNWLHFLKFKVLVSLNRFKDAHEEYALINRNLREQNFHKKFGPSLSDKPEAFFNIYELKYEKCVLLFKEGDYETAIYGLTLLEGIESKPKYQLLKKYIQDEQNKQ